MVETAGSCGYISFKGNTFTPSRRNEIPIDIYDYLQTRAIIRHENRIQELEKKGNNSNLNTVEALELSAYKIDKALENFLKISKPTIFYKA